MGPPLGILQIEVVLVYPAVFGLQVPLVAGPGRRHDAGRLARFDDHQSPPTPTATYLWARPWSAPRAPAAMRAANPPVKRTPRNAWNSERYANMTRSIPARRMWTCRTPNRSATPPQRATASASRRTKSRISKQPRTDESGMAPMKLLVALPRSSRLNQWLR